jgi:ATP-dependent DNA ligase
MLCSGVNARNFSEAQFPGFGRSMGMRVSDPCTSLIPPLPSSVPDRLSALDVMCCREVSRLPEGPEWIYEMKWHGCRVTAMKAGDDAWVLTRNRLSLGSLFPKVAAAVAGLSCHQVVLDGQLLALDEEGRICGCPLEMLRVGRRPVSLRLEVFDLLELDGRFVEGLPCHLRKQRLDNLLSESGGSDILALTEELEGPVHELMEMARQAGQAGIVGKRRDSTYEEGRRDGEWVKCLVPPAATRSGDIVVNLSGAAVTLDRGVKVVDGARRAA